MERSADSALAGASQRNRLLKVLAEPQRARMLAVGSVVGLEHHRAIYREEGVISAVYFPVDAVFSLLVSAGSETSVEIATVGNEGLIGISAVLGVPRALGRTVVQIPGQAISIPARVAARLLCDVPGFSLLLHRYMFAFLRQIAQAGACNRLHTAEQRCARWLLATQDRAGTGEFDLTQEYLAAMMGARRPTMNQALSFLRDGGAVDYSYGKLKVLDRGLLESFSCPCYGIIRKTFEMVRL
jgi:CRP-like cAMP-binding protein